MLKPRPLQIKGWNSQICRSTRFKAITAGTSNPICFPTSNLYVLRSQLPRSYPVGFGKALVRIWESCHNEPRADVRNKLVVDPLKTDRELFTEMVPCWKLTACLDAYFAVNKSSKNWGNWWYMAWCWNGFNLPVLDWEPELQYPKWMAAYDAAILQRDETMGPWDIVY